MLEAQGGVCACCGGPPTNDRPFCVDHCHTSGAVRGLLCDNCNIMIANAKDDPARLALGMEYLRRV